MLYFHTLIGLLYFLVYSFQVEAMMSDQAKSLPLNHGNQRYTQQHAIPMTKEIGKNATPHTHTDLFKAELIQISKNLEHVDAGAMDTKNYLTSPRGKGLIRLALREQIEKQIDSAINQGSSYSQNYIGNLYLAGRYFENDSKRAAKWFCLAALKDNQDAMLSLAKIIKERRYVPDGIDAQRLVDALSKRAKEIVNYESFVSEGQSH